MKSLKNYFPAAVLFGVALLPLAAQADNSVTRWVEHSLQTVSAQNVGTPNAAAAHAVLIALAPGEAAVNDPALPS